MRDLAAAEHLALGGHVLLEFPHLAALRAEAALGHKLGALRVVVFELELVNCLLALLAGALLLAAALQMLGQKGLFHLLLAAHVNARDRPLAALPLVHFHLAEFDLPPAPRAVFHSVLALLQVHVVIALQEPLFAVLIVALTLLEVAAQLVEFERVQRQLGLASVRPLGAVHRDSREIQLGLHGHQALSAEGTTRFALAGPPAQTLRAALVGALLALHGDPNQAEADVALEVLQLASLVILLEAHHPVHFDGVFSIYPLRNDRLDRSAPVRAGRKAVVELQLDRIQHIRVV